MVSCIHFYSRQKIIIISFYPLDYHAYAKHLCISSSRYVPLTGTTAGYDIPSHISILWFAALVVFSRSSVFSHFSVFLLKLVALFRLRSFLDPYTLHVTSHLSRCLCFTLIFSLRFCGVGVCFTMSHDDPPFSAPSTLIGGLLLIAIFSSFVYSSSSS